MASSENLASIEPWIFRPTLADSWLADYVARDAETLTRALQKSLSGGASVPEDPISPFMSSIPTTPTVSGISGSDQEPAPKRHRIAAGTSATGRVSKRKPRASKRSQTMFITADPSNFRQMVQQVTGVRFGGGASQMQMAQVVKPEPKRLGGCGGGVAEGRFPAVAGCLPTLDTSAFLLDHHHQQQIVGSNLDGPDGLSGPGPVPFGQPLGMVDGTAGAASSFVPAADFEPFSCFPTLESWKVM